jgi:signal transduction histidine kinase
MGKQTRSAVAITLIAIVGLVICVAFLIIRIGSPSDGTFLKPGQDVWVGDGLMVTALEERPGGLQTGDIVLAIDGVPVEALAERLLCLGASCPAVGRPHLALGQTAAYTIERDGQRETVEVTLSAFPVRPVLAWGWGGLFYTVVNGIIITYVFIRRPTEPAVQALMLAASNLMTSTIVWVFGHQLTDFINTAGFWTYVAATQGIYLFAWCGYLHFMLLFPQRHPLLDRHRWLAPAIYPTAFIAYLGGVAAWRPLSASTLGWMEHMPQTQSMVILIYLVLGVAGLITNYRRLEDGVAHQQVRIVVFSVSIVMLLAISLWALPEIVLHEAILSSHVMGVIGLILPLSLALSILHYRLWDIDLIINRTLVYSTLTGAVVAIYVVVVGTLGALLQEEGRLAASLFAAGVVAVAFQPLRDRVQRAINRLMYGERDEPYAVLSRLGRRLEAALAPGSVLTTIVETVAQALKLPYVAIALWENDQYQVAASVGAPTDSPVTLPLTYQTETIGRLICARRAPGEPFNTAELHLLGDVAHQAGVAMHAVRLTADLQHSRERLVTTREEERRRLRRDLHDGLGPTLAALHLQAGTLRRLIRSDPAGAEQLVEELRTEMRAMIDEIRRLVYELRPPALDELGLVGAIQSRVEKINLDAQGNGLRVRVSAPDLLPTLPAATEVAAYRIAQEALTNVVRHAGAASCVVRLELNENLCLEIADDGVGFQAGGRAGVGIVSMRERAEELGGSCTIQARPGGGTQVCACLPLPGEDS